MRRRGTLLGTVIATAVLCLVIVSPAAAAYSQLWSSPLATSPFGAHLAVRGDHVFSVWPQVERTGKSDAHVTVSLCAQSLSRSDGSPSPAAPLTLVTLPVDDTLAGFVVSVDSAGELVIAWKDATTGVTATQRFSPGLLPTYAPVELCTDGDLTGSLGGASATPQEIVADAAGGYYVRLRLDSSPAGGDTLLNHVSSAGTLAVPAPGKHPTNGSVGALAVDASNRACALLVPPGRSDARLDRYTTALTGLASPVSPYGSETPSASPMPSAIGAFADDDGVAIAWRDARGIRLQRFSSTGSATPARLWASAPAVSTPSAAFLASDAMAGLYLATTDADDVILRHFDATGKSLSAAAGQRLPSGLSSIRLAGAASDRAGAVWVAYRGHDAGTGADRARLVRTAYFPVPPVASPIDLSVESCTGLEIAADGLGGVLAGVDDDTGPVGGSATGSAAVKRVGPSGIGFTMSLKRALDPGVSGWPFTLTYGSEAKLAGYGLANGVPGTWSAAKLQFKKAGQTTWVDANAVQLTPQGFWSGTAKPTASGSWRTVATTGGDWSGCETIPIGVRPVISARLTFKVVAGRLVASVTGKVAPAHVGQRLLLKRVGGTAFATLGANIKPRSTFSFSWRPSITRRSKYVLQVVLPAHADHLEGRSPKVTGSITP